MSAKKHPQKGKGTVISLDIAPEEYEAWLEANPRLKRIIELSDKAIAGDASAEEKAELAELYKPREGDRKYFPGFIDDRDDEQRARDIANGRDDRTVYEDHLRKFGHPMPDPETENE